MRVWVTRDEGPDGALAAALRESGLTPVLEPVIARRATTDARETIARLTPDDWLVLTSPFAIASVAAEAARVPQVAVVGEPSRVAAEARGFRVTLVSAGGGACSLFAELAELARGRTVCYPRSSLAEPPALPADITLLSPVLYETAPRAYRWEVLDEIDVIAVASPSAVRAIDDLNRPVASIGGTTTAALRERGIEPWVEAPSPGFAALARVIADQAEDSWNQRA